MRASLFLGASLTLLAAAGCSNIAPSTNLPPVTAPAGSFQVPNAPAHATLYLAELYGEQIAYYRLPRAKKLLGTIDYDPSPHVIAMDPKGTLYMADLRYSGEPSYVYVFPLGATRPTFIIRPGYDVAAIAADTKSTMYIQDANTWRIAEYRAPWGYPFFRFSPRCKASNTPGSIAVDLHRNFYVSCSPGPQGGSVNIFRPRSRRPFKEITDGLNKPGAIVVDRAGTVYVANDTPSCCHPYIQVYPEGSKGPALTIPEAVKNEQIYGLVVGTDLSLYVDDFVHGWVFRYEPGRTSPSNKYTFKGRLGLSNIAVYPSGTF